MSQQLDDIVSGRVAFIVRAHQQDSAASGSDFSSISISISAAAMNTVPLQCHTEKLTA